MFDFDRVAHDVIGRIARHYQLLGQSLYRQGSSDDPTTPLQTSPLYDDLLALIQIANGAIDRATADDELVADTLERVQRIVDLLFARAAGSYSYAIPYSFWSQSEIGQVLARVQAWLRQDDLISLTEAAQLLFPDLSSDNLQAARMRIKRLTERGEIMVYVSPNIANPTRQARVSRQAIEALQAASKARLN